MKQLINLKPFIWKLNSAQWKRVDVGCASFDADFIKFELPSADFIEKTTLMKLIIFLTSETNEAQSCIKDFSSKKLASNSS